MDKTQSYLSKITAIFSKTVILFVVQGITKKGIAKNNSYSPTVHAAFVANTTIVGAYRHNKRQKIFSLV
ncbi:hypothetical protein [Methylomonas fluvii]|nr:hypothetical protein [Methylomonas fluvii]